MEITQATLPIAEPEEQDDTTTLPGPCDDTPEIETPDAVRTKAIERPKPRDGPASTEIDTVPKDTTRVALFSGGADSLATTILAMEEHDADFVMYLDTNTGVAENLEYVRDICEQMGWPLYVAQSPVKFVDLCKRYGPPGVDGHTWAYNRLKERQLSKIARHVDGTIKYFSGVRAAESDRRKINVTGEVEWETNKTWNGWWVNILWDKSDTECEELIDDYGLDLNPLYDKIGRSGDCWCLAYGGWDEIYGQLLSLDDPDSRDPRLAAHGAWLLNVQTRVQEYRGRLEFVEEEYPDIYETVGEIRKQQVPHPSKMQVMKKHYPDVYDFATEKSIREAVRRAKQSKTNWIGHGGTSSEELREAMTAHDDQQARLCGDDCGKTGCPFSQSAAD